MQKNYPWFNIFVEEYWYINFIEQNQVFNAVCQSAKDTFQADTKKYQSIQPISGGMHIDPGIDKFFNANINRCAEPIKQKIYFCHTCQRIYHGAALCQRCFFEAKHVEKGHTTSQYNLIEKLEGKLKCQCGDPYLLKKKGACQEHMNMNRNGQQYLKIMDNLKQHIRDCFKISYAMQKYSQQQSHSDTIQQNIKQTCLRYLRQLIQQLSQLMEQTVDFASSIQDIIYSQTVVGVNWNGKNVYLVQYYMQKCIADPQLLGMLKYFNKEKVNKIYYKLLSYVMPQYVEANLKIILQQSNKNKIYNQQQRRKIQKQLTKWQQKIIDYQQTVKAIVRTQHACSLLSKLGEDKIFPNPLHIESKLSNEHTIKLYYISIRQIVKHNYNNISPTAIQKMLFVFRQFISFNQVPNNQLPYFIMCVIVSDNQAIINQLFQFIITQIKDNNNNKVQQLLHILTEVLLIKFKNDCQKVINFLKLKQKSVFILNRIMNMKINKIWVGFIRQECMNSCTTILTFIEQKKKEQEQIRTQKQKKTIKQQKEIIKYQDKCQQIKREQKNRIQTNQQQERNINFQQSFKELKFEQQQVELQKIKNQTLPNGLNKQVRIKSEKQLAMEKKRKRIEQRYALKRSKIKIPQELQRVKSNDPTCIICREPSDANKHLLSLGNIFVYPLNYQQIVLKNKLSCKYGLTLCQHTVHTECFIRIQNNYAMCQKCPLCKQKSNIGLIGQNQVFDDHVSAELLQFLQINHILKNQKDILKVFQELFAILVGEMYEKLFFWNSGFEQQKKENLNLNNKQLVHMLQQIHRWNKTTEKFSSKNMRLSQQYELIIIKQQQIGNKIEEDTIFSQVMIKLNKIVFLAAIGQITEKLQVQQISKYLNQLQPYVSVNEMERIWEGVSQIANNAIEMKLKKQKRMEMLEKQGQENRIKRKQDKTLMNYLFELPQSLIGLANSFKPSCKKYKQHLNKYWMCIMCNKIYCGHCQRSVEEHKASHQQVCAGFNIFDGVLTACVKNKTNKIPIFQRQSNIQSGQALDCWQFLNGPKYRSAIFEWVSMMKAQN